MMQGVADAFTDAFRAHPQDWHMMQRVFVDDLRGAVKVGIVCPYSLDVPGGVQNHVKDLAEALIARGHQVSVLAPSESGATCRRTSSRPGAPCRCPTTARWPGCRSGRSSPHGPGGGCVDGDFDVLHLHEPATPSLSLLALWAAECPVVATYHSSNERSRALSASAAILRPSLEKISARIAVSEYARGTQVSHVGGEPVVIPNGLYVDRFASAQPRPEWRRRRRDRRVRRPARRAPQGLPAAGRGVRRGRCTSVPGCGCSSSAAVTSTRRGSCFPSPAATR